MTGFAEMSATVRTSSRSSSVQSKVRGLLRFQVRHQTAEEVRFGQILPVALCELLAAVDAAREYLHVGEDKLEVNRDNIVRRVERSGNVDDVFVLKAAHDMDDGVHLANVCQKLVAKPLAPGRAAHEPGDIHELNDGGRVLFGVVHLRQHVEPFVRHGTTPTFGSMVQNG